MVKRCQIPRQHHKKAGNWPTQRPMHRKSFFNTTHKLGGGVELGYGVWYPVKAHHTGHNLPIITKTLSLSVYEPIAIQCCSGESPPNFIEWVELGGRVRHFVKLLHIRYNLFVRTEMLSLSVYEPIAIQILLVGTVPEFVGGVELKGWVR